MFSLDEQVQLCGNGMLFVDPNRVDELGRHLVSGSLDRMNASPQVICYAEDIATLASAVGRWYKVLKQNKVLVVPLSYSWMSEEYCISPLYRELVNEKSILILDHVQHLTCSRRLKQMAASVQKVGGNVEWILTRYSNRLLQIDQCIFPERIRM